MPDELDELLDEAIKSYSGIEPSPDLAGRILRQAQRHGTSPRRGRKLAFAFAVPLAAAAALAVVLLGQLALPKPPAAIAYLPSTPDVTVHPRSHAHKVRAARSATRPLPAPYSKEELALLTFVQQHPKEAAEIAAAQKRDLAPLHPQPITISQLEIKPLNIAPLNQEK
jgi:hypothetical protein